MVYLTVRFTSLLEAYNRSTNTAHPGQLFGVSLESVVEQENSGFLVPLLVKRCTSEIEKRGLDIIGLYRLCGSETKKKMLRESFEADPEAVDLSSENVPDINVITSKWPGGCSGSSLISLSRFTERVPAGATRTSILQLSLPNVGGCSGCLLTK